MTRTADYDLVVVGASCAGLVVAQRAAAAGLRTLLLDTRSSFSEPTRTWIVTQKIERLLDCDVSSSVVHRTGVMELLAPAASGRVSLANADLVVERAELRRILAREAEAAGAAIEFGHRVQSMERSRAGFQVRTRGNGNGIAPLVMTTNVVGADGVKSVVAEAVRAAPQRVVPVVQARVFLPDAYDPDVTRVWFHPDRTRYFYWLIPESSGTGVVGLIAERPTNARQLLDDFLVEHDLRRIDYQGAMIPLHQPRRRIEWRWNGGRALLVGDAAAHVKVTTVGGVVSGIWGATAAARALVQDTSYRRELVPLHRELYLHDLVRWVMNSFHDRHYHRLLELLNSGLYELLSGQDRDSYSARTWSFVQAQPRLFLLALDALTQTRHSASTQSR